MSLFESESEKTARPGILKMLNPIQTYDWGSTTALAALQGRSPSGRHEAELWMGAHPQSPSRVELAGAVRALNEVIAADPRATLGSSATALPYLLKVLAIDKPLSIQAHPSREQAQEGFARENAAGIPLTAPHRNYKDPNAKPEVIVALTPFDAMSGFRAPAESRALYEALQLPALAPVIEALASQEAGQGIRAAFEHLLRLPAEQAAPLASQVAERCRTLAAQGGDRAATYRWAARVAELYPGDVGAVSMLLLNLVHLQPGQALNTLDRTLHFYLSGVGVELMANSDNVLRGGLTSKHVDKDELLRIVDFSPQKVELLEPIPGAGKESGYPTRAPEFRLSRLDLKLRDVAQPARRGPEILLCTEGHVRIESAGTLQELGKGSSAFVCASEGPYTLRGAGTLFRATPGETSSG